MPVSWNVVELCRAQASSKCNFIFSLQYYELILASMAKVFNTPSMGFGVPFEVWVREVLSKWSKASSKCNFIFSLQYYELILASMAKVFNTPSMGFGVPFEVWVREVLSKWSNTCWDIWSPSPGSSTGVRVTSSGRVTPPVTLCRDGSNLMKKKLLTLNTLLSERSLISRWQKSGIALAIHVIQYIICIVILCLHRWQSTSNTVGGRGAKNFVTTVNKPNHMVHGVKQSQNSLTDSRAFLSNNSNNVYPWLEILFEILENCCCWCCCCPWFMWLLNWLANREMTAASSVAKIDASENSFDVSDSGIGTVNEDDFLLRDL